MAPVVGNVAPPVIPPAAPWRDSGWTGEGRLRLTRAMCEMLEEAGMQVVSTFGSKEMTPYSVSSPRMIVVSKKQ